MYPHVIPYPAYPQSEPSRAPIPRPQATLARARSQSISSKRHFMAPLNTSEDPWPEHSRSTSIPSPLSSSNGPLRSGKMFDISPLPALPRSLKAKAPTPTELTHRRHKSEAPMERPLQRSVSHLRSESARPTVTLERSKSVSSPTLPPSRPPRKRDSLTLTMEKLRKARALVPGPLSSATIPTPSSREVSVFEDDDDDEDWSRY